MKLSRLVLLAFMAVLVAPPPAAAARLAVSGRLIDVEGEPIAGATVEVLAYPSAFQVRSVWAEGARPEPADAAESDREGTFSVRASEVGLWLLAVRSADHPETIVALRPLVAPRALGDIVLPPARELTVRARDAEGAPISGALILVRPERPSVRGAPLRSITLPFPRSQARRTGDDGSARLLVPDGVTLHVSATASGFAFVELEEESTDTLEVTLRPGVSRALTVRSADGGAQAGALVVAGRDQVPLTATDEEGRAVVTFAREAAAVAVIAADGSRGTVRLTPPSEGDEGPVKVVLEIGDEVVGSVIDARSREGVAGALVYAGQAASSAVFSDARGRYRLRMPVEGRSVQAAKAGYEAARARIEGDDGPTLALTPAGRLVGRVVDRAGAAVAGAEVRSLGPLGRHESWRAGQGLAESDEQGRFELTPVPVDVTLLLVARRRGFAPAEVEATARFDGEDAPLEIVLAPGRAAIGTVVDATDRPLAGVAIGLVPAPPSGRPDMRYFLRLARREEPTATTDAEGRFRLEDLAPGRFDLQAQRTGFAPARVPGVSIAPEELVTDLGTVVLLEGAVLEGLVVDPDDRPVAGATVSVQEQGTGFNFVIPGDEQPGATTGADGRFAVADLRPGALVRVEARSKGFAPRTLTSVQVPPEAPVRIVLAPGVDLEGSVVDARGNPVARALVQAHPEGRPFGGDQQTESADTEGRFLLSSLAPGTWTVIASAEGFQKSEKTGVELAGGTEPPPVRIELRRGGAVAGTVTGADGAPLAEVRVQASEEGQQRLFDFTLGRSVATTDAAGAYRLDGLPAGRHVVSFSHPRHREAAREIEVGIGEIRLDVGLEVGLEIAGRVVDGDGRPVAGAQVAAQPAGASLVQSYIVGGRRGGETTDAEGAFRLGGLDAGSYSLSASKDGFATATTDAPIELVSSSVEGLELRLGRGGTVVGTVLGIGFDDLTRLQLVVFPASGPGSTLPLIAAVDHEGRFRVENVPAGTWMVLASLGQQRTRRENVTMPEGGGEVSVELDFGGGFAVSGTVRLGAEPGVGLHVLARGVDSPGMAMAITDPQGGYRLEGLEPGRYAVTVQRQMGVGRPLAEREVVLDGDQVFDIELEETRISGRVVDPDGLPIAGAKISLMSAEGTTASVFRSFFGSGVRSGEDGRYRLDGVGPGSYRLVVEQEGFASASQLLTIDEAEPVSGIDVVLVPSAGLELVAVLPSGQPARSVTVAVLDAGGGVLDSGTYLAGETGVVRLTRLGTGTHAVLVRADGTATAEVTVTVPGPRTQVALPAAGTLHLRVPAAESAGRLGLTLSRGGRPVRVLGPFGQMIERWDLITAETAITPLAPGPVEIQVTLPDGTVLDAQAAVVAGQTVGVEVR